MEMPQQRRPEKCKREMSPGQEWDPIGSVLGAPRRHLHSTPSLHPRAISIDPLRALRPRRRERQVRDTYREPLLASLADGDDPIVVALLDRIHLHAHAEHFGLERQFE